MPIEAQIQFTQEQIKHLADLRRQTGASRTELVRRAVDYLYARNQSAWRPTGLASATDKRNERSPLET